jgi:putative inorganic carbon (HCO3(-)) transporter
MHLPAEPLMALLSVGILFSVRKSDVALLLQRSSIFPFLILGYTGWLAISALGSTMPFVSFKYVLVEATHVWVFGIGFWLWPSLWQRCLYWMGISMTGLSIYVLLHHATYHFRPDQANLAPMPFFPESNIWACLLVMLLFWWLSEAKKRRLLQWFQGMIWIVALFFSGSRGAWLSGWLALGAGAISWASFRAKWLLWGVWFAGLVTGAWLLSTRTGYVSEQERINRWNCAWRMAEERPILGFGPGTYQFQYIPFQQPEQMTRISLTSPLMERTPSNYGRGGGAHSEFARALSETGLVGLVFWLALFGVGMARGFQALRQDREVGWGLLALGSFLLHGLVNDFLHNGTVAALVLGTLVYLYHQQKQDKLP